MYCDITFIDNSYALPETNANFINHTANAIVRSDPKRATMLYHETARYMDQFHHYMHYFASYLHHMLANLYDETENVELANHHYDKALFHDRQNEYAAERASASLYNKHFSLLYDFWNVINIGHKEIYKLYYDGEYEQCVELYKKDNMTDSHLLAILNCRIYNKLPNFIYKIDSPDILLDMINIAKINTQNAREILHHVEKLLAYKPYSYHADFLSLAVLYMSYAKYSDTPAKQIEYLELALNAHTKFHHIYHLESAKIYTNLAYAYAACFSPTRENEYIAITYAYKAIDLTSGHLPAEKLLLQLLMRNKHYNTAINICNDLYYKHHISSCNEKEQSDYAFVLDTMKTLNNAVKLKN